MEVKSMSKSGKNNNKKKSLEHVGFDLDDLVGDCLNGEDEYGLVNYGLANDSQYFEIKGVSILQNVLVLHEFSICVLLHSYDDHNCVPSLRIPRSVNPSGSVSILKNLWVSF
ncbi:hypothetical protein U1Q18_025014 [Sarracenia purpurea var. burkii]